MNKPAATLRRIRRTCHQPWLLAAFVALFAGGNSVAEGQRAPTPTPVNPSSSSASQLSRFALDVVYAATTQFLQQGPKLVGERSGDSAGFSVALSADGNTAVVGAPFYGGEFGGTLVWTRSGGVWTQQGPVLQGSDHGGGEGPVQGWSVAVSADGNTAIVGGPGDEVADVRTGAAWVWTRSGDVWTQQGPKLVASGDVRDLGESVSLSADGNTALVGGLRLTHTENQAAAWVWTRSAGVWTKQGAPLIGSGAGVPGVGTTRPSYQSVSLSADGNTAIVGGSNDDNYAGAAWIWTRTAGIWTQQGTKLVGSGAAGTAGQGASVSLSADGNTAIIGGSEDDASAGAAWVWNRSGGVWTQQGNKLVGSGATGAARQGRSVSLSADGNTALVGGPSDNNLSGAAWVWSRSGEAWTQQGSKLVGSDATGFTQMGTSVSLSSDANTAMVGGPGAGGAAWVFTLSVGPGPTSVDDSYVTAFNTTLTVTAPGVLSNDSDNGGGSMTADLISTPVSGSLTFNTDGGFTFVPPAGFSGPVTFTYRAMNGGGSGAPATVTITVGAQPSVLGPPANLITSSIAGNTVTITWTAPTSGVTPTGYVLEGGISPGQILASVSTGSAATTFTFTAPTGAFYIRMHSQAPGLKSVASNEIRIFVNVPAPPSAPANLLGFVNGSSLGLAWANTFAGGIATGLILDVTGSLALSMNLPLADTFSFAGVPSGTYTMSLRSRNNTGISASSNTVTMTFPGTCSGAPSAPTSFVATKTGNVISASWGLPASGPAPAAYSLIVTGALVANLPVTARRISGAVPPGTYTLSVVATNPCGGSGATTTQTVTIP